MDLLSQVAGAASNLTKKDSQGGGGVNVDIGKTFSSLTSGGGGNLEDKLNSMAGGGAAGEANEDYLDKVVDLVQERVLKQGAQDNESAAEQAKDEVISDTIRQKYQEVTGKEFFIKDKAQQFGNAGGAQQ